MKTTIVILLIAAGMVATFAVRSLSVEPLEEIPFERLNGLTNGITLAQAETILGANWQHQFTASIGNTNYLCVSYHFQYSSVYYYFLFRGHQLAKICVPPPFSVEIVEQNGMRVEVRKPANPIRRVEAVMDANKLSPDQLISDITRRLQDKRDGENLGFVPAFIITSPLLIPRMMFDKVDVQRESWRNQELANRFDPQKLNPGASLAQARRIYGEELSLRRLSADRSIICWGSNERLRKVKSEHRFSKVCALIENERVQQVYSHDFELE
ncbi:MAG: hypothetical protein M5U15_04815 [Kiritimatiellae bacterium]|nr:hypothetical protein [Kiritimatiellia bacterium]